MAHIRNESGFSPVETLLLVIIIAIIGVAGYKVYSTKSSADKLNQQSSSEQVANPGDTTPPINSASDLNKAEQALDQVDPDENSADSAQIDSQLSAF